MYKTNAPAGIGERGAQSWTLKSKTWVAETSLIRPTGEVAFPQKHFMESPSSKLPRVHVYLSYLAPKPSDKPIISS